MELMSTYIEKAAPWTSGRTDNVNNAKLTSPGLAAQAVKPPTPIVPKAAGQVNPPKPVVPKMKPTGRVASMAGNKKVQAGVGIAAVGAAGIGGAKMRQNRRDVTKSAEEMGLVDPFAKAYKLDEGDASNVRIISRVVPTGRRTKNDCGLLHVTGRKGAGGPATQLGRYGRRA